MFFDKQLRAQQKRWRIHLLQQRGEQERLALIKALEREARNLEKGQ